MTLSDRGPGRTAKPLFIGSIPIAASNLLNNLETLHGLVKSYCSKKCSKSLYRWCLLAADSAAVFSTQFVPDGSFTAALRLRYIPSR